MTVIQDDAVEAALATTQPRHVDLARTLMQDIRDGKLRMGELLPTEAELCATWNLSRYAVRQAVLKLCNLGMISRQAGVGTRVIADRPQTRYVQSMDTLSDLVRYAQGTTLQVSTRRTIQADDAQAALLRSAPGAKWLHIAGIRHGSDAAMERIALVDIYVDKAFSQLPGLAKTLDAPVYTMVEEQYGVRMTRVEQEVQGLLIEGEQARALQVKSGSAGLRIIRTYFVRDKAIVVTTGVHPASRFSYSMTFQLAQTGG
ncbi:GntR family transcriptional regulator [Paraburkholderia domus]|uniref:GntR family transcriptional regulator n=1 Tax=Paraburkholderia domus TaxID=2793075 RepID=UPI001B236578|nr:GntR family transcriptional regulator [Paraburkholderia domus]CAE6826131.1 putative fructoselysine utilization operon transcriptional repressor [Paraburkholderia domus]